MPPEWPKKWQKDKKPKKKKEKKRKKDLNKQLTKKDAQRAHKYVLIFIIRVIREMQMKSTMHTITHL